MLSHHNISSKRNPPNIVFSFQQCPTTCQNSLVSFESLPSPTSFDPSTSVHLTLHSPTNTFLDNFTRYRISTLRDHLQKFKLEYNSIPAPNVINLKPHWVSETLNFPQTRRTAFQNPHHIMALLLLFLVVLLVMWIRLPTISADWFHNCCGVGIIVGELLLCWWWGL